MKRWFVGFLAALLMACASAPSTRLSYPVPVVIQNFRSREAAAPHFYLVGLGRHPLGVVEGNKSGNSSIDARWIPTDGSLVVLVHYTGGPDIVSAPFIWHLGEYIDIKLNQGGEPLVAWSHR